MDQEDADSRLFSDRILASFYDPVTRRILVRDDEENLEDSPRNDRKDSIDSRDGDHGPSKKEPVTPAVFHRRITAPRYQSDEDYDSEEDRREIEYYSQFVIETRNRDFKTKYPVPENIRYPGLEGMESMESILKRNLKDQGLKYLLHRFCLLFRYNNDYGSAIYDAWDYYTRRFNREYKDDPMTGLLLYYQGVGLLTIEGNELAILDYVTELPKSFLKLRIEKWKVLTVIKHVVGRMFQDFCWITADPAPDIGQMPDLEECDKKTAERYMGNLASQLKFLWRYLRGNQSNDKEQHIPNWISSEIPSKVLLNFCLDVDYLEELEEFTKVFETLPEYHDPDEELFPLIAPDIPYHVLSSDPLDDELSKDVDPDKPGPPILPPPPLHYVKYAKPLDKILRARLKRMTLDRAERIKQKRLGKAEGQKQKRRKPTKRLI